MTEPTIRHTETGELDEFIAQGADVHVEAMAEAHWWIGISLPDGRRWIINVGVEDGEPFSICEEG